MRNRVMGGGRAPVAVGVLGAVLAVLAGVALMAAGPNEAPKKGTADLVRRGAYLVSISGCNDCHTPLKMGPKGPEPDMSRMLSGHPEAVKLGPAPKLDGGWMWAGAATNTAFAGPWGISYAINLTPDPETGIGAWTEENFVRAMQTGQHMGVSRPILPPMPWQSLHNMTATDLRAVFAYLKSIKPIRNRVPSAEVAPPPAG